jgi:hypothetical protein
MVCCVHINLLRFVWPKMEYYVGVILASVTCTAASAV